MAAQIIDTIERDGKTIWVYDNGMEKDASNGHIVKPPPHTLILDTEKSTAFHRQRQEKKIAVMVEAANEAVNNAELKERYGDLAFVAEYTKAIQQKARNPKDPKQVDAARFLEQGTGLSPAQERGDPSGDQGAPKLYLLIAQLHERQNVVEGELVSEIAISASNNDAHSSGDGGSDDEENDDE